MCIKYTKQLYDNIYKSYKNGNMKFMNFNI